MHTNHNTYDSDSLATEDMYCIKAVINVIFISLSPLYSYDRCYINSIEICRHMLISHC